MTAAVAQRQARRSLPWPADRTRASVLLRGTAAPTGLRCRAATACASAIRVVEIRTPGDGLEPADQAARRRRARRQRQDSAFDARGGPQHGVAVVLVDDLHQEHRRSVHQHLIAGVAHADRERLGVGIDRARRDRGADRDPGRVGGLACTVPTTSRATPAAAAADDRRCVAPSGHSTRRRGWRRADRTGWRCDDPSRIRRSASPRCTSSTRTTPSPSRTPRARGGAPIPASGRPLGSTAPCPPAPVSRPHPIHRSGTRFRRVALVSTPYRIAGRSGRNDRRRTTPGTGRRR